MKKLLLITLMTAGFTSFVSFSTSVYASEFSDYATVKRVEPQYSRTNQPSQKCQVETVQETIPGRQDRSYGGAVIGGVAGGLVGNQIGRGHGREAATAIGAVVGALTGDNLDNRNSYNPSQTVTRDVQHCYLEDNYVQKINNYKITYEYKGRTDTFISPVPPMDNRVRVNINVTPVVETYVQPQSGYSNPPYEAPQSSYPSYPSYVR